MTFVWVILIWQMKQMASISLPSLVAMPGGEPLECLRFLFGLLLANTLFDELFIDGATLQNAFGHLAGHFQGFNDLQDRPFHVFAF